MVIESVETVLVVLAFAWLLGWSIGRSAHRAEKALERHLSVIAKK